MERNEVLTAPYISYHTFYSFLEEISEGLPRRIDRHVLSKFNGTVRSQLIVALRFLRLINENKEPTSRLETLRAAFRTDHWEPALLGILNEAYRPFMPLARKESKRYRLLQEFQDRYPSSQDTTRKQVTFFVKAAKDAGVKLSPGLEQRVRRRKASRLNQASKSAGDHAGLATTGGPSSDSSFQQSRRVIQFQTGGSLTVSISVSLLELKRADREFLCKFMDHLDAYESTTRNE